MVDGSDSAMGDVQISRFTIPVELLFFSWLEIRNKTGLACSKELPPGTPKPQVLNSTQLPPLSGYDKIHFLGWCSKHNTKRMCTQSLAFWLHHVASIQKLEISINQ